MVLEELLVGVRVVRNNAQGRHVERIDIDSRCVRESSMFIAISGTRCDGNDYISDAIARGASVIVSEHYVEGVPCVVVDNVRQAYSIMSANFFGNPARRLKIIAVVGTNGKSTCAHFVHEILSKNGYKVGFIGTGIVRYAGITVEQDMTTPDPHMLHHYFALMVESGVKYVVMEVSAQAIYLDKMYGIHCELGLFTNLSEDHLDFFDNMDIYKRVKMSYFNARYMKVGIVNSDDICGREIMSNANMPVFTYGLDSPSDVFAIDLEYCKEGTRFVVNMLDEISHFWTEIVGRYNVYNILGAALVARLIGIPMYSIRETVTHLRPLEGRYNVVHTNRADFVIDYAHTPEAMRAVISETRRLRNGGVYVVFGCGGDRDRTKRAIMGDIASTLADGVVLTSDNSRSERTCDIIDDILEGVTRDNVTIIENRADAIRYAYEMSDDGDIVLVLGKGAERIQDNGEDVLYYSDREAILDIAKG